MACSHAREAEDLAKSSAYPPQEQVEVSLKVEADISDDDLRAMTYWIPTGPNRKAFPWIKEFSGDRTIPIHCVIRSDHSGDAPTFMTLPFTFRFTRIIRNGRNEGKFLLEYGGTGLVINADKTKKDLKGRNWYVMGIIGGTPDKDNSGNLTGKIKFRPPTSLPRVPERGDVTVDVPYTSDWIKLEVRDVYGEASLSNIGSGRRLQFRPRGSLLRLQFGNDLPYSYVQVREYVMEAAHIDSHVDFSLNVSVNTGASWSYADPIRDTRIYKLGLQTKDMPAGDTDGAYYLLWVMSDGTATKGFSSVNVRDRVRMRALQENENDNKNPRLCPMGTKPLANEKSLEDGKSYRLEVRVVAGYNPLEVVTDRNIGGPASDMNFMSSHKNSETGIYTASEVDLFMSNSRERIVGHHVPEISELRAIFGGGNHVWQLDPETTFERTIYEVVRFRYQIQDFNHKSTYQSYDDRLQAYGMRFQGGRDATGQHYTAWRYSSERHPDNVGEPDERAGVLVVKSLYLGPGAHQTIKETSNEDWWNNLPEEMKNKIVVTKSFPSTGSSTPKQRARHLNHITLWSRTPNGPYSGFPSAFMSLHMMNVPNAGGTFAGLLQGPYYYNSDIENKLGLRLFKD